MSRENFSFSTIERDHYYHFTLCLMIRVSRLTVFVSAPDDKTQVYRFTIIPALPAVRREHEKSLKSPYHTS